MPVLMESRYYPWVLCGIFSLLNAFEVGSLLCGMFVGYLEVAHTFDWLYNCQDPTVARWEESALGRGLQTSSGFVKAAAAADHKASSGEHLPTYPRGQHIGSGVLGSEMTSQFHDGSSQDARSEASRPREPERFPGRPVRVAESGAAVSKLVKEHERQIQGRLIKLHA